MGDEKRKVTMMLPAALVRRAKHQAVDEDRDFQGHRSRCPDRVPVEERGQSLMRCAIYARKSTEQDDVQDKDKSVATQVEAGRTFAASKGWPVLEHRIEVDDAISGREFRNRPGLIRLQLALKPKPDFNVLLIHDLDQARAREHRNQLRPQRLCGCWRPCIRVLHGQGTATRLPDRQADARHRDVCRGTGSGNGEPADTGRDGAAGEGRPLDGREVLRVRRGINPEAARRGDRTPPRGGPRRAGRSRVG